MTHDIFCPDECFMGHCKEHIFCCCWLKWSKIVNYVVLVDHVVQLFSISAETEVLKSQTITMN